MKKEEGLQYKILYSYKDYQEFVFNFMQENWGHLSREAFCDIFNLKEIPELVGGEDDDEYPELTMGAIQFNDEDYEPMQFPGVLVFCFDQGWDRVGNYSQEILFYIPFSSEEILKLYQASKA